MRARTCGGRVRVCTCDASLAVPVHAPRRAAPTVLVFCARAHACVHLCPRPSTQPSCKEEREYSRGGGYDREHGWSRDRDANAYSYERLQDGERGSRYGYDRSHERDGQGYGRWRDRGVHDQRAQDRDYTQGGYDQRAQDRSYSRGGDDQRPQDRDYAREGRRGFDRDRGHGWRRDPLSRDHGGGASGRGDGSGEYYSRGGRAEPAGGEERAEEGEVHREREGYAMRGGEFAHEVASGDKSLQEWRARSAECRRPGPVRKDWICSTCSIVNFARRTACFRCSAPRTPDAQLVDSGDAAVAGGGGGAPHAGTAHPSAWVIVKMLDAGITEQHLSASLAHFGAIEGVEVARDRSRGTPKGYAFVKFASEVASAAAVAAGSVEVYGQETAAKVEYRANMGGVKNPSEAARDAAAAASAMAGYTITNSVAGAGVATGAAASGFAYDADSGYYKDPSSGMYYDAATALFYDPRSSAWYSWDTEKGEYVPATAAGDSREQQQQQQQQQQGAEAHASGPEAAHAPAKTKKKSSKAVIGAKAVYNGEAVVAHAAKHGAFILPTGRKDAETASAKGRGERGVARTAPQVRSAGDGLVARQTVGGTVFGGDSDEEDSD